MNVRFRHHFFLKPQIFLPARNSVIFVFFCNSLVFVEIESVSISFLIQVELGSRYDIYLAVKAFADLKTSLGPEELVSA